MLIENNATSLISKVHVEFTDAKIVLFSQNSEKDLSFVNGEYTKITHLSKQTIFIELNKYIILLPKTYSVII